MRGGQTRAWVRHSPRMGVYLCELNLVLRDGLARAVEDDEARTRGSLVYRTNVKVLQLGFVELLFLVVVYGRAFKVVTLGLGHGLRLWPLGRGLLNAHGCTIPRGGCKAHGEFRVRVRAKDPGTAEVSVRGWGDRSGLLVYSGGEGACVGAKGDGTGSKAMRTGETGPRDLWKRPEATVGHAAKTG